MASQLLQQPFIQITLPILIGFVAVGIWQNRRLDDIVQRLIAIEARLALVEKGLAALSERVARLEERTSPFARSK